MNPSHHSTPNSGGQSEVDFGYYLDMVINNRWLIAAIACVFFVLGTLYSFIAPPVYRADIMLQVEDSANPAGSGNLVANVSSLFHVKSVTSGEIEILRSRLVVSHAVDTLRLYITATPDYFPLIGQWIARQNDGLSKPGLLDIGGFVWGAESIGVDRFDVPEKLEDRKYTLTAVGGGRYRLTGRGFDTPVEGQVGKAEVFQSNYGDIFLTVNSLHANPGADFKLIRSPRLALIEKMQKDLDIQEKGKQQSDVIGASLTGTDPVLVSNIMNDIGETYVRQNVARKSEEAAKSLEFLGEQLPKLKKALENAEQIYNKYRQMHGTIDVGTEGKLALQQSVDVQTQMLGLQQRRADLLTRFGPSHPSVTAIDEQTAQLRKTSGLVDSKIEALPAREQEVVRYQRDVEVNKELYLALFQSSQQLSLLKAAKVGAVRQVDNAPVPEMPVWPIKLVVLPLSLLVGLLFGVVTAFIKNILFGGIADPLEIEQYAGLSVCAAIPYADAQRQLMKRISAKSRNTSVLALLHPHEPAVESLRSFRTSLQFAMLEAHNNVVLFTGPAPGVGKSFVSANFATLIASGGKRVLLIDADMRKGYLNQFFGQDREGGLSELLSRNESASMAIRKTSIEDLDFISTGTFPPDPAELLLKPHLTKLIEGCAREYDVVVIDAPPILAVTDAAILASLAATTFLIALSGTTKAGELVESARRVEQGGGRVNGVLLNGIRPHSGRYGYGAKYGRYRYVAYSYAPGKK
ncbi:polysaccharide biosynthesis tyrosine autokinase [Paraburkholderia sediminicola]|uniref:polysaccharide biosynthesis tyrosine autokinase n=1 Tax=Paraburkholderia sediminicola TaxID=458836 RepID=UPI0038B70CD0